MAQLEELKYWQRQTKEKPLFPNVLWERPERRDLAGKLLVIGGSSNGVHDPALAYEVAKETGIGDVRVAVPESLKQIARHMDDISLLPATSSGNFSIKGREPLLFAAQWADGVLAAGNLGRNSETTLLLSNLIHDYRGPLTLTKDAVDSLYGESRQLLSRDDTLLIVSFAQLQRLAKEVRSPFSFRYDMDFLILVQRLHEFSETIEAAIVTKHLDQIIVCLEGQVISTGRKDLEDLWCVEIASKSTVFWLHNRAKMLEAVATALI